MATPDFAGTPVKPLDATATQEVAALEQLFALKHESELGPRLVVVGVHLPHVVSYGLPDANLELVYRWPGGELNVGDLVLCPGTKLHPEPWTGIVLSLDASNHPYAGYVRNLLGKVSA